MFIHILQYNSRLLWKFKKKGDIAKIQGHIYKNINITFIVAVRISDVMCYSTSFNFYNLDLRNSVLF